MKEETERSMTFRKIDSGSNGCSSAKRPLLSLCSFLSLCPCLCLCGNRCWSCHVHLHLVSTFGQCPNLPQFIHGLNLGTPCLCSVGFFHGADKGSRVALRDQSQRVVHLRAALHAIAPESLYRLDSFQLHICPAAKARLD